MAVLSVPRMLLGSVSVLPQVSTNVGENLRGHGYAMCGHCLEDRVNAVLVPILT